MGTRRSRHNKGRKPLYKDYRSASESLLQHKRYGMAGAWLGTRSWWSDSDKFRLTILCEADADPEGAADALGRSPKSIAYYAKDQGIVLPRNWTKLIAPRAAKVKPIKVGIEGVFLSYPYIAKPRPEHCDLLTINSLIPRSVPESMRGDMCQEIMLAILEGRTSIETLKTKDKSASYFVRKFYKDNFEDAGRAISFSREDERSYDEIASSIAAKDWHWNDMNDRRCRADAITRTGHAPDQFMAAFHDQVGRAQMNLHELGHFFSRDEVEEWLEESGEVDADAW